MPQGTLINITLSTFTDPEFWISEAIQLLFGIEFFIKLITAVVNRKINGTAMMEIEIGVILFGKYLDKCDWKMEEVNSVIEYIGNKQLDKL